jgi:hypothetical protein
MDDYPFDVVAEYPERSSRLLALAALLFGVIKALLLLPHIVVLSILGFVASIAGVIGWIAVLFMGSYPRALFDFQVGILRWNLRVNAYFLSLTDRYPPFRLEP